MAKIIKIFEDVEKNTKAEKPNKVSSKKAPAKKAAPKKKRTIAPPEELAQRKKVQKKWEHIRNVEDKIRDVLYDFSQSDISSYMSPDAFSGALIKTNDFKVAIKKENIKDGKLELTFLLTSSKLSNDYIVGSQASRIHLLSAIQEMSQRILPHFVKTVLLPKFLEVGKVVLRDEKLEKFYVKDPVQSRAIERGEMGGTPFSDRVNQYKGMEKSDFLIKKAAKEKIERTYDVTERVGLNDSAINNANYSRGPIAFTFFFRILG